MTEQRPWQLPGTLPRVVDDGLDRCIVGIVPCEQARDAEARRLSGVRVRDPASRLALPRRAGGSA